MRKKLIAGVILLLALPGGSLLAGIPGLDDLIDTDIDVSVVPKRLSEIMPITTKSHQALEYYRHARQAQWNFDFEAAVTYYKKALKKDPTFVRAHLQMHILQPGRANWHREQALESMYLLPRREREFVQMVLDNKLVVDNLKALSYRYPNDAEIRLYLADAQHDAKDFAAARDTMLEAVRLYPPSAIAWQSLGEQYQSLKVYFLARPIFEKEISLVPDRAEPYLALGNFYLKTGRFDKAIHVAQEAIKHDPNAWQGYVLKAYGLTMTGDYENAQEILLDRADVSGDAEARLEYRVALVDSLIDTGNYPEAIKYLNALYGDTSTRFSESELGDRLARGGDIYFLNRLGDTYLEYGNYGSAQDVYDNVLRICEASPDRNRTLIDIQNTYMFNTARVALARDDTRKARRLLSELQSEEKHSDPDRLGTQIAQLKGEIELVAGEPEMAIEYLHRISTDNPYILYLLAMAYDRNGQQDKAKKYYKLALEYRSFDHYQYAFVRHKARAAQNALDPLEVGPE